MLDHELIPMTVDDRQVLGRVLDQARDTMARDPRRVFAKCFLVPALVFAAIIAAALFIAHRQGWVSASDPVMHPLFWAVAGGLLVLWGWAEFARARRSWRAQRSRLSALESDWAIGQLAVRRIEVKSVARVDTPGASALAILEPGADRVILIDAGALFATDARAPRAFELKWCLQSALTMPIDASDRAVTSIAGPILLDVLPVDAPDALPLRDVPDALRQALVD